MNIFKEISFKKDKKTKILVLIIIGKIQNLQLNQRVLNPYKKFKKIDNLSVLLLK